MVRPSAAAGWRAAGAPPLFGCPFRCGLCLFRCGFLSFCVLVLSASASCLCAFFRFLSFSSVGSPPVLASRPPVARGPARVVFVPSGSVFVLCWVAFGSWFLFLCSVSSSPSSSPVLGPSGLPFSVLRRLAAASSFGVCGSRSSVPAVLSSVLFCLSRFRRPVSCGCCGGVAAAVRGRLSFARRWAASSFFRGSWPAAFVARSCALVASVVSSPGSLWVSFPGRACPPSCVPGLRWSSCGSGSWSSLALVVGAGRPALLFLPVGVVPPAWGFRSLGSGWWFFPGRPELA